MTDWSALEESIESEGTKTTAKPARFPDPPPPEAQDDKAKALARRRLERTDKLNEKLDETREKGEISPEEMKEYRASEMLPSMFDDQPVWSEWSTKEGIEEGFHASSWVYACVWRLAKSVAAANWVAKEDVGDGESKARPDSALQAILDNPNPAQSRQTFFEMLTTHLYLGGNGLVSKVRANGIVAELWPIHPNYIKPVPSSDPAEYLRRYEYERSDVTRDFEPEDIIHFKFTDPDNQYWGMAPLRAAAKAVDTDNEMSDFQKVSMQNRAVADGVFSYERPLSEDQWEEAREQVKEQHQGSDNARTPWVLGSGAEWHQMSMSPAEMDFIKSRKVNRAEICTVFAVPPPLVGIYENATLNNIQTARLIFWEDTMIPLLEDIKQAMNLALAPEFGEGMFVDYDVSHISALLDVLLKKLEIVDRLWSKGVPMKVLNQWLDLGIPEFDGWDQSYIKGGMMPADAMGVGGNMGGMGDVE